MIVSRVALSRWSLWHQMALFLAWVAVIGFAVYLRPSPLGHGTHQQLGLAPCLTMAWLGRPCPGCGLTTSWTALVHGQLGASFQAHWFGPLTFAVFTAFAWVAAVGFVQKRAIDFNTRTINIFLLAVVGTVVVYGILRFAGLLPFSR